MRGVYPMHSLLLFLFFCLFQPTTHAETFKMPTIQTERIAIQWIGETTSTKKQTARPSLESYSVAVLQFPAQKVPPRMTCGARLFELDGKNSTRDKTDLTQETIKQIAASIYAPSTSPSPPTKKKKPPPLAPTLSS